jgi:hypothetical protein
MKVVALGDSVTSGVGDRTIDGPLGWAAHLATMLEANEFTNLARTGARMRDVLTEQTDVAINEGADLATLLIGGNDVLRNDFDANRVAADAAQCCQRLTEAGALVLVVLLHDPSRVLPKGGGVFGEVLARRAAQINSALHTYLDGVADVVLLDPSDDDDVHQRSVWHIDRMHPSDVGHRLLATKAAGAVAARGLVATAPAPPLAGNPPNILLIMLWLLVNGIPWFIKRSTDLVPELIRVVIADQRQAKQQAKSQGQLLTFPTTDQQRLPTQASSIAS